MKILKNLARWAIFSWILLTACLVPSLDAFADARVELILVTESRVPITGPQEWSRRLGQAGIDNVQIRSARSTDKPGIESHGTESSPIYIVTGSLNSANELVTPGGRFRIGQEAALARWLGEVARYGPEGPSSEKSGFGLSAKDFERLQDDLSKPLGFSTEGTTRADFIRRMARELTLPLRADPKLLPAAKADKIAEDLSSLTRGTALAYVVRPLGMSLIPQKTDRGLVLAIVEAKPKTEVWPIGWKPEKKKHEILPKMYEFVNINVQGVSVSKVLDAISQRLEIPILLDHNALARHGVDPDSVVVSQPAKRTTYSLLLKSILFKARLKSELRTDESDAPFLWITTLKPLSAT